MPQDPFAGGKAPDDRAGDRQLGARRAGPGPVAQPVTDEEATMSGVAKPSIDLETAGRAPAE